MRSCLSLLTLIRLLFTRLVVIARDNDRVTLTIVNGFDVPICYVYFPLSTDTDWGEERLGSEEVIEPDAERQWGIEPGIYDLQVLDCSETVLADARQIELRSAYRWEAIPDASAARRAEAIELNGLGLQANREGRYAQALNYFQQALTIAREISDRQGEGATLTNIGGVYRNQGRYAQALNYFQQALAIAREIRNWSGEGATLSNIGQVYHNQGQYIQALDYYQQALSIAREVGDRSGEGQILNNIGGVYHNQGQYIQALDYYQQALTITREIGDRPGEGVTLSNIGTDYEAQGSYAQAQGYYQQALTIQRENGNRPGEGTTLGNIGAVYHSQGSYVQALDYYQQALTIAREIGDRQNEGATLGNIGEVYHDQGQYTDALDYFQQVLTIQRENGNRPGEGIALTNIGGVYHDQGQYAQALDHYQQVLSIQREVDDRPNQEINLSNIGTVYDFGLGESTQAINYYRQAVEVQESLLQAAALNQAIISLAGEVKTINLHTRLTTLLIQENDLPLALKYAERGRDILSRDELRNQPIDFRANLQDQSLLEEEQRLRLALLDAQNLVNGFNQDLSASNKDKQNSTAALIAAQDTYDRHLERMQLQGGFLARELALEVSSQEQIQAALSPDTTLLLYGICDYGSYALLVTTDNVRGLTFDTTTQQVDTLIRAFASDRQANADALRKLYDLVFASVADKVTTSNLIISPDGVLNYVPFAALQTPDSSYLVDHFAISYVTSGTALVLLNERQPAAEAISPGLVLAQPVTLGLPRLQQARSEAETVVSLLGVEPITDANESDLRVGSTGAAIIHITAHAEFDHDAPLYSVIHLGADSENDGRFEVREIYELDLSQGTEQVVLSGCETGSGGTGEDFGLLARAFFGAGADQVLASLWQVDDAATAQLITTYLKFHSSGDYATDAQALQAAMITTRESYPNPYFWASFVLVGET